MRKSHVLLLIAAWFGLAIFYVAFYKPSEESEAEQASGFSQGEPAVGPKLEAQEERIEKLEARLSAIEKHLEARLSAIEKHLAAKPPVPKRKTKANTKLQEHLNVTQELHIAEDVARSHVRQPTEEHLQTIRRLHEARHNADESHSHPPIHVHLRR